MPLFLKRHMLLVQADLKIIFTSIWFYFILLFSALIVWSFTLIQPRDHLTRILVIDELDNAHSHEIAKRISDAGYRIEYATDYDKASLATKLDKAYAVIKIADDGQIYHRVYSIMAEDVVEYTLRRIVEHYKFEHYQRSTIAQGKPWPELDAMAKPFMEKVDEGNDNVAVIIVSGIWYLAGITTLVLWILSKDGFAKLMRIYSFFEILLARTVAGTLLGCILGVVFFGTAWALDIKFASYYGLFGTGVISIITGVLTGLLLGAGALATGGSILALMMIGLLGITLLFLYLTIVSGIFVPVGGIPWILNVTSRWMPLFGQIELLRWSALAGHSLTDPICVGLIVQLGIINVGQFVLALLFLRRV
jgi:hypothetical protein